MRAARHSPAEGTAAGYGQNGTGIRTLGNEDHHTPPPPCASTALSKHGVGVEPPFLGICGTTVFVVPDVTWSLKPFYHTLPPDDVCFDVILSHSCYFPSTAYRHLHLRDLLDVGSHVCLPSCVPHAGTVLSKHGVGVEPLFCLGFWDHGRACAGGGRGTVSGGSSLLHICHRMRLRPQHRRTGETIKTSSARVNFFLAQTKMSWRSLLTSQYSR